jgi:hypothetical protein
VRIPRQNIVSSRARWPAGDGGDFDPCATEAGCAHGGPDWPRLEEVALVHSVEALEVGQVCEMDQAGHDVCGRAAARAEKRGDLAERVFGLILNRFARAGLAGQEHPIADRKARRVRPTGIRLGIVSVNGVAAARIASVALAEFRNDAMSPRACSGLTWEGFATIKA